MEVETEPSLMSKLNKSLVGVGMITLAFAVGRGLIGQVYAPQVLASGNFHQVAHKGAGLATITRTAAGKHVLRLTNFSTSAAPGLSIVLISAPDAYENTTVLNAQILKVGQLQQAEGDQEYALPDGLDLQLYQAVTIWNPKYQVNFTTAPLRRF